MHVQLIKYLVKCQFTFNSTSFHSHNVMMVPHQLLKVKFQLLCKIAYGFPLMQHPPSVGFLLHQNQSWALPSNLGSKKSNGSLESLIIILVKYFEWKNMSYEIYGTYLHCLKTEHTTYNSQNKQTKISDLETNVFELNIIVKSGLVFFCMYFIILLAPSELLLPSVERSAQKG